MSGTRLRYSCHAQAQTIARPQKELQEAQQTGGASSGSKEKAPEKKEEKAPEKQDEKKEELKEDKKEEQKEEKKEGVVPEEEKKDEEPKSIMPFHVDTQGVSTEALRAREQGQLLPKIRPAPSEASSFVEVTGDDEEPRRKRGRFEQDRGEAWTCFRCLTKCGRLSKSCQVPVNQLSNPALVGSWLRIAFKGRPDDRGEFTQLKSEIQIRGLVEPQSRKAGEEMLRDLNTAMGLGNPVPQEYRRASTVEMITEMTTPAAPTTPTAAMGSEGEPDAEYGARVRVLLEALQTSTASDAMKAQIVASLQRK